MGNGVFTYAKGSVVRYTSLVAGTDQLAVALLQSTGLQADTTLRNYQTLATLLGSNTEATFTNYCVDPETECLTRRAGWTRYDEIGPGDEILAYDPATHTTRWERPEEIYVNPDYRGPMWDLSMRGFSAVTTPNHRWPAWHYRGRHPKTPEFATLTTETLPPRTNSDWRLLRSAPFASDNAPVYSDAFVRIAAWYFTEGCLIRGGKSVTISQSPVHNPENVEAIRLDLKEIGAVPPDRPVSCTEDGCNEPVRSQRRCALHAKRDYMRRRRAGEEITPGRHRAQGLFVTERTRESDGLITWDLFGSGVDELIAAVPGFDKIPTMELLGALTPAQARMFVDVCIAADGTEECRRFDQYNADRMDAFQAAAVLAGHGPTLGHAGGTSCHLNEAAPHINLINVRREMFDYQGVVWCPTLPSGYWVARRDGKVHITGNSRKTVTSGITNTADTTNSKMTFDMADITWTAAGGATNNTLGKMLICWKPTSSAVDSAIVPIIYLDFTATTTGSDLLAQFSASGIAVAS